ncbi:glutamyl-tRNA amidotransferas-like protein [Westerdykella ornata]|uniref:Glutamyl-tRNA(Gln) amidotransferase subunit A, mitochondrial n=1 Tax=Westerdykella ornata TaxID=318751 RepID=A0A6A6JDN8_WESOR|nr:glutamyl-tRNA amidotransferas-like protein [Westerdykella ornata]KAF2274108.1 glutamyl-tRNA amidotransferas-like protein [Westerdykella ornata]
MSLSTLAKECIANQSKYTSLNAFISLADRASILSRVAKVPPSRNHGPDRLSGQLIAVKDNICTSDLPTTAGSGILKNFTSPYDATVVKQLRDAGAVIAGKTNLDEFGMGSHSVHSFFGPVKNTNARGEELSAGGSSGGSAVAVATGQCTAALGTDTGGSVRLPAAYTGVVGFKPSYGLVSRWGVIAYANSLDTVGVLAKSVAQMRRVFDALNFHDPQDPTSLLPSTRRRLGRPVTQRPLRIGIPLDYNISSLDPTVRKTWMHALKALQQKGHTLHTVNLPATRHALSAYYILAPAEASSNLAKYDGVRYGSRAEGPDGTPDSVLFAKTRGRGFGDEVQRRILLGAFSLSAQAMDNYFIQAQKIRRLVQRDFDGVFSARNPLLTSASSEAEGHREGAGVDVLVCPTAPTPAPELAKVKNQDPVDAYMNDVFTVPASLAGLPAVSVPVKMRETQGSGAGIGMQVIGQFGDDGLVLDVGEELMGEG